MLNIFEKNLISSIIQDPSVGLYDELLFNRIVKSSDYKLIEYYGSDYLCCLNERGQALKIKFALF